MKRIALETLRKKYALSSCQIAGNTIEKELYSSPFSARMLHSFLAENTLSFQKCVLYHPDHCLGYLCVHDAADNTFLLAGPYLRIQFDNDNETLYQYIHHLHIPYKDQADFFHHMTSLPFYTEPEARKYVLELFASVTGQTLKKESVHVIEPTNSPSSDNRFPIPEQAAFINQNYLRPQDLSESCKTEAIMLSYVENGDPEGYANYITNTSFTIHSGVLKDNFRNMYHATITSLVLVSRAAIRGGLAYSDAQQKLDIYLAYLERLDTIDELMQLIYHVTLTFAADVRSCKLPEELSPILRQALYYIQRHMGENVRLKTLARELCVSEAYLSKLFTKELHTSFSDYLTTQKTEEAKRLLSTSALPLNEISEKLGFSSQSYFQNVF